ncbi:MAG: hypothetical protein ACRELD_06180 [Longimicrobiales bacterium]
MILLRLVGGCIGRLIALALLLLLGVLAWLNRDRLADYWNALRGGDTAVEAPSPELADEAESKLARLQSAEAPERIALGEAEVQSLIDYRIDAGLPDYLIDPVVTLEDGRMGIAARVPTEAVPDLPGAGELATLLPDTTDVAARAQILPLEAGRVALAIDEMTAARIPLPARMIPSLLRRIGRSDEPGLPADAIPLRLPRGACSAYIRGDSLVLLTRLNGQRCN